MAEGGGMDLSGGPGKLAWEIASRLKGAGHTAYFAGGCVRDFLMGKEPQDFDIATSALPGDIEKIFPRTIPVGRQFGVMLVVMGEDRHFEVATFRTEGGYQDGRHPTQVAFTGPEEDARRRDFTINGLFYDPFARKILDYVGGQDDLNRKVLRAIGDPRERFEEDKLRLLRAVRFAAALGFEIEPGTWNALCAQASAIACVSPERIRDEIVKMLTRPGAARGFTLLSESGLLRVILPEIEAMKGVAQPPQHHPEGDVFVHTRLLLEKLDQPTLTLALAALFHDVAKPPTYAVRDGKITFYEHAPVGGRMTRDIMRRLRFSNEAIDRVAEAVENHMTFKDAPKMREGKLRRFISRDNFAEELELHRIDCLSSHGSLENYRFLKDKIEKLGREELKPVPLLNGHDIMALGLKPGPRIREILDEAYTLQLEGAFGGREDALAWARREAAR